MPRQARKKSPYKIYHIMMRGINKQQIFFAPEDYRLFEFLLYRYKEECGFDLLAYCLMGNHIHLLIHERDETIGNVIKHIGTSFVYRYNTKYERTGHLFQDRFRSEPVDSEAYLLTVFRYIHNNPVKAGITKNAEDYSYSSAREYLRSKSGICDQTLIRIVFGNRVMKDFMCEENDDKCLDLEESTIIRCDDEKAQQLIDYEMGTDETIDLGIENRGRLNDSICKLINSGISIRQLSRFSGIPKKIIENAIKH